MNIFATAFTAHWMNWAALFGFVFSLLLLPLVQATPVTTVKTPSSNLVSAEWLRDNLADPKLVLIDTSMTPSFIKGHIVSARHYDFYRDGGRQVPTAELEKRFQSWGISDDSVVVLYDAGGEIGSPNLFFELVTRGFPRKQLFVLDGGLTRWVAIGGAVSTEIPAPATTQRIGNFKVQPQDETARVRLNEFLIASGDTKANVLIDALDADYYYGGAKFFDRGGHVPHSKNIPTGDFFNADKTFKSRAEIDRMAKHLGIDRQQQVLSHCGGGVAAMVPWFALNVLLDYPNVRVYKESQREWLRDERQLPFWTYAEPRLLREQQWLAGWNHWMLRGAGAAKLNVVDVRSAEAYTSGHVPYAIHLSGAHIAALSANAADASTLANSFADALSAKGVNHTDEIVIVSDGGLNRESALAFVRLRSIGHTHVSLLKGSMDDWNIAGFELTKMPTSVGQPKTAKDIVAPATTYVAKLIGDIVITAGQAAPAETPRIYLGSGNAPTILPANAPRGKLLHMPYTAFVATDGTPKSAQEIWSQLDKAGVSRYAEIVTVADDISEAAINFVVLALMGFADVKVMKLR